MKTRCRFYLDNVYSNYSREQRSDTCADCEAKTELLRINSRSFVSNLENSNTASSKVVGVSKANS
jgi:hypothetical protein